MWTTLLMPMPALEQLALCKGRQQSISKSGLMKRGPEAIAGTREVMAHRRR